MKRGEAISGRAAAVAGGVFVAAYGTNVSTPFLVLYKDRLDLGSSATMAIFVVYVLGILGTLLVIGQISDRIGRRAVCLPFIALSGLASLIMIAGRDQFLLLLLGRFLLGVVSGAVLSVGTAWLQEILGHGQEMKAAVLSTVVTFGGFGLGPLTSALMAQWLPGPLVTPFIVHAVATFLMIPVVARVPDVHRPGPKRPLRIEMGVPASGKRGFQRVIIPTSIWVFAFPSTSFALFPVLVSDSVDGSEVIIAGIAGTVTALTGIFARPVVNRFGARTTLPLSVFAGALGYLFGLVAFTTGAWALVFPAAALMGAASGVITAGCLTLLGAMASDEGRGALTSTFYLLAYPGMAMPLLLTSVASIASIEVALMAVSAIATACGVFAWTMRNEPVKSFAEL